MDLWSLAVIMATVWHGLILYCNHRYTVATDSIHTISLLKNEPVAQSHVVKLIHPFFNPVVNYAVKYTQ